MPERSHEKHYRRLAKENVCEGVLYEPRMFFDEIVFDQQTDGSGTVQRGFADPDVFRNGEQFPIQITHILAAMRPGVGGDTSPPEDPLQGDPRLIQRYGLAIRAHDTFYMNDSRIPFPLWHNVRSAPMDIYALDTATWRFERTFPLGQRDTLSIQIQLRNTPGSARRCAVAFEGTGRASGRPYKLASTIELSDTNVATFNTDDFRNDGGEVIDVHQMAVHVGAPNDAADPVGDIQEARIGVVQQGNGTQMNWEIGPVAAGSGNQLAPGALWGPSTGRAVIHKLPGNGWIWQPGQGVTPELENFNTARDTPEAVDLAFLGHIIVT